jgi:predicted NBD/HSP70 family sugar kinase
MNGTILGLDIGGTKIACVEGTLTGDILQREEIATRAELAFDLTFPDVLAATRRQIIGARREGREIMAVSVAVGGPLRIREGRLLDPPPPPGLA